MRDVKLRRIIRVAIVAEHASARFGGEAMLPLQYFRHLRKRGVDAYLVVHARVKTELDELFPRDRNRISYVPDTWVHKLLWWLGRALPDRVRTFTTGWLLHLLTQAHQRPIVRRLVRERGVNVVHEPIPVSPRMPSLMYNVGAPVIIGPMNGGMSYPPGFRHLESWLELVFVPVGRWLAGVGNRLIPGKRRAALLLVANERTRAALPVGASPFVRRLVENGVDLSLWRPRETLRPTVGPTGFVYLGRLVRWKGVDLLLQAFARVAGSTNVGLEIIGDGPERRKLERLARRLGVDTRVTFHGFMPQDKSRDLLAECDALVLPSLYECGGAVVLEAMAMGLPVVASDWGGPVDYVGVDCACLIEVSDPNSFVTELATVLTALAQSEDKRRRLGEAARERVRSSFSWEQKTEAILRAYHEVCTCSSRSDREEPVLGE